jgi:hypothetical protein
MNVTVFENKIKLKIYYGTYVIETDQADCEFETMFTDEKDPNTCKLKIYNLNEKNVDNIITDTKYVEIWTNQYGEKDSDGLPLWQLAFEGLLREAIKKPKVSYTKKGKVRKTKAKVKYLTPSITTGDDEADDYVQLELQEGKGADIGTFVSKSYRKGFNVKKILTDMAKSIDMEIVFDKNVKDWNVTYPIILHDNVRNSLDRVASYIGCKAVIGNGRVYIASTNPEGVITYYWFDETNIQQPNYLQDKKIEFIAPYMPTLLPAQFVKLTNNKQQIDGVFQIVKIESKFSNHSEDCESKITVKYE